MRELPGERGLLEKVWPNEKRRFLGAGKSGINLLWGKGLVACEMQLSAIDASQEISRALAAVE